MRENTSQTRRSFLQLLGISGFVGFTGVASATPGRASGPKEDEILVGVSASASSAGDMESHVDQHVPGKAAVVHSNETLRYVAVKFPGNERARKNFIDAITKQDGIKYAEPNPTHTAFLTPSDERFSDQYAPQQVNAPAAWDTTLGSSDVTIAVLDTGVDYTHTDLAAQFGSDKGYDFAADDSDPMPVSAIHGTHVAGIASATTDNGTGVAGISNSTLISGRVLGKNGFGSTADIADGITWATDQGADIINMSLGGVGYTQTLKNAVSYAVNNGTLPICANGNAGNSSVSYPAAYDECVAVAASREGGEFVDDWKDYPGGSNYGPKTDVIAPGERVLSSVPGNSYKVLTGTSMASPAAAGVAALGLAADPDLTVSGLRNRLKSTAVDIGEPETKQGSGRVDANNIVDAAGGGDDGDGGGGEESTNQTVSGSLSGGYDYATYSWNWEYSDPSQLTLELAGPSNADFDLYVNEGTTAVAGPRSHDYASTSPNSQESITIDSPATSTALQITVDSYSGWGSFDLTFTEFK
jgi:serine protease